jgi:hypothetical protein
MLEYCNNGKLGKKEVNPYLGFFLGECIISIFHFSRQIMACPPAPHGDAALPELKNIGQDRP